MPSLLAPRRVFAALVLLALASPGAQALGWRRYETSYVSSTAYLAPTTSILAVPTSYYVPSSYVLPTSYVVPTTYATTAYAYTSSLTPTYYLRPSAYYVGSAANLVTSSYLVPTARASNYVVRRYIPTVASTVVDYPVVTSTTYLADDCGSTSVIAAPAPVASSPSTSTLIQSTPTTSSPERRPTPSYESAPDEEPTLRSGPAPTAEAVSPSGPDPNPPAAILPEPDYAPTTSPAERDTTTPPAPADFPSFESVVPRETRRPVYSNNDPGVRPVSMSQGILEGRVVSADNGQPEGGVRVILTDRRDRYTDRVANTDALGRYAFNLPEGDWTVRVEMPSRKVFPVKEITVSGGQITTTDDGRELAALTIKR